VTFTRSRDIPFIDDGRPEARDYQSTIDVVLDLVAELPHPDPAQGSGCRLVLVDQHASLVVEGPVVECESHPTTGVH
jgi:hypothetical protein